jgi:hypothetical protein
MGFWQGINQGLIVAKEEKARKRELDARQQEIETERDIRKQERAEDRKFAQEDFTTRLTESRRDALLTVFAKREADRAAVQALSGKANLFLGRLEGSMDPRVAALANDPATAAALEDKALAIETARAEKGIELPPLQGEILLDLLTVQVSETGQVKPVDVDIEDLMSMDLTDRTQYEKLMIDLSRPTTGVYADISPEAFRIPDPKRLEEGRALFDQEVLRAANAYLTENAGDASVDAKMRPLIEGYAKAGSAERFALQEQFGAAAAANILSMENNPYVQDISKDPQLAPFVGQAFVNIEQQKLKAIVDNPATPADQRQEAIDLLKTRHGVDYGG